MGIRKLRFALLLTVGFISLASIASAYQPIVDKQVVPDFDGDEEYLVGGSELPSGTIKQEGQTNPAMVSGLERVWRDLKGLWRLAWAGVFAS